MRKKIAIVVMVIGVCLIAYSLLIPKDKENKIEKMELTENDKKKIIELANLDGNEYPIYPFKVNEEYNQYNDATKDEIVIYYAKRMNLTKEYAKEDIDICNETKSCLEISEKDYKGIIEKYNIEEYENIYLTKNGEVYYFLYERIPSLTEAKHDYKMQINDDGIIEVEDEITYDEYGLGDTKMIVKYTLKKDNNSIKLIDVKK